jgi:hypothetical protein
VTDPTNPASPRRGRPLETNPRGYRPTARALVSALRTMIKVEYGSLRTFHDALSETGFPIKYQELSRQLGDDKRFPNGPHRHVVDAIVELCDPDQRAAINDLVAAVDAYRNTEGQAGSEPLKHGTQSGGPNSASDAALEPNADAEPAGSSLSCTSPLGAEDTTHLAERRPRGHRWRSRAAVLVVVLGAIAGLGLIAIPNLTANSTQGRQGTSTTPDDSQDKVYGCRIPAGVPLAVLGGGRANSPLPQQSLLLQTLLDARTSSDQGPLLEMVEVDSRPSIEILDDKSINYRS